MATAMPMRAREMILEQLEALEWQRRARTSTANDGITERAVILEKTERRAKEALRAK